MGFLQKFGEVVLRGLAIASGVAPLAGPMITGLLPGSGGAVATITSDLQLIAGVIQNAEVMGQAIKAPGQQKLIMAAPLVEQIVLNSSLLAHHKIANEAAFRKACEGIASNTADLLNSLEDKVETQDKA